MALKTTALDIAELLEDEDDIRAFLAETVREGTPEDFLRALAIAARAQGMTDIARQVGVSRASLYKSLSAGGNPEFFTIAKVMHALGLKLTVAPA
ncbi:MAG: putative addiction module antidote protein [Azoarcus sp.]|jgi:probable addiction module antidote protein|nr:putative addiction module antidote protein [Azoarcus sp.]